MKLNISDKVFSDKALKVEVPLKRELITQRNPREVQKWSFRINIYKFTCTKWWRERLKRAQSNLDSHWKAERHWDGWRDGWDCQMLRERLEMLHRWWLRRAAHWSDVQRCSLEMNCLTSQQAQDQSISLCCLAAQVHVDFSAQLQISCASHWRPSSTLLTPPGQRLWVLVKYSSRKRSWDRFL